MWNKITNSLLFYSDDYYNNDIYKNKTLIKQIYFYYKNRGLKNIILTHTINILISIFLFLLIVFLFNCIHYKEIFLVNEYSKLKDFIDLTNYFKFNIFFTCLFISFSLFIITKIANIIELAYTYSNIKNYYNNNLEIADEELEYIKWETVITKIEKYNDEEINIYKINSIILFYDNYLNLLFDKKIITISHLTNLMEWNIQYCILLKIFGDDSPISTKKNEIYHRIRYVSVINFVFMPFILVFILFYNIFNYGEEFYNKPTLLTTRVFTKKALWKFKYYNELPHDYESRITKIIEPSNKYIKQFKQNYFNSISRLIIFVCSSFFIILISLSIINDKILLYITIINNKSVFWFISILASIITIFKINNKILVEPKKYMEDISSNLYLNDTFVEKSNTIKIKNKFLNYYQYKIVNIIKDIIYTILTPFKLWMIGNDIDNIMNFITNNIDSENKCKPSVFDDSLFTMVYNEDNYDIDKTIVSLIYYNDLYPKWSSYMIKKINGLTNEMKINVI
jgi:autophagy-related protein 9